MATTYARLRMFWGAFDLTALEAQTPQYGATQIVSGGPDAAFGSGVGVRRATLVIDRKTESAGADDAMMHFDFLNVTGGTPDDTWTSTDYSTLEGYLLTWWTAIQSLVKSSNKYSAINWHRVGTGVPHPNPAERSITFVTPNPGTDASPSIPQSACSITFRTAVRRSWGRTYLPIGGGCISAGRVTNAKVDTLVNGTAALVSSAAGSDFHLVVLSGPLSSSLNVEAVEVDNVPDVIRRRRWKQQTYRHIVP